MRNITLMRAFLCLLLSANFLSCATQKPARPTSAAPAPAPPATRPVLTSGPMKVVVLRLENNTTSGVIDKSSEEDQLFGNGIRTQIINALRQTGQFVIEENTGPRKVLWTRALTSTGAITREAKPRFGSFGNAEIVIAGVITAYLPSQESKAAGVEADLFFREAQAQRIGVGVRVAGQVFSNLAVASQDRVEIELRLLDAKTGETIATTTLTGTPQDSAETVGGMFGPYLAAVSPTMQTPMQRALRGCAVKAVNWIAEKGLAFRERPPVLATPAPAERSRRGKGKGRPPSVKSDISTQASELSTPSTSLPAPVEHDQWGGSMEKASPPSRPSPQENKTEEWGHEK